MFPIPNYHSILPIFDPMGYFSKVKSKEYVHEPHLEDHWMNYLDNYEVRIKYYCELNFELVTMALDVEIPSKALNHDP